MKAIWKYKLEVLDEQTIEMPVNARILTVDNQYGDICLWAEVNTDPDLVMEKRTIYIHGTGHQYMSHRRYIGSVQMYNGNLVFHVFE